MTTQGMNPELVRQAADEMDRAASSLHALVGSINGTVSQMSAGWFGDDVEQLVERWRRVSRPAVEALVVQTHGLASRARQQAHEQDVTSGSAGLGAGSRFPGGADFGADIGRLVQGGALLPTVLSLFPGATAAVGLLNKTKSWDSSGQWHGERRVSASGATTVGGVPVSGDASARAYADAEYSSHAELSRHGAAASAAASVGVGVAAAANARVGNQYASATGHAGASAEARAEAKGNASIGLDGAKAHGEFKAFAGAQADASVHGNVGGVDVGAGAHVYAGIGVHADVDASVTFNEVKASVDVGAALGLGAGFKVSVEVHPQEVVDNVMGLLPWNRKW